MSSEQQSVRTDCCTASDQTNQESLESVPDNVHKHKDAEPTIKQRTSLKNLSRKQLVNALIRNKVQLELPSYFYPDETPEADISPHQDYIGKIIPLKTDNSEFSLQKVLDLQFKRLHVAPGWSLGLARCLRPSDPTCKRIRSRIFESSAQGLPVLRCHPMIAGAYRYSPDCPADFYVKFHSPRDRTV